MALYDFWCSTCKVVLEEIVPPGAQVVTCPECGAAATRVDRLYAPKSIRCDPPMGRKPPKWTDAAFDRANDLKKQKES